jgi:hypothetical protein
MTIPHKSPHACHGEPTLENGMSFLGQACAASVPHHTKTGKYTHLVGWSWKIPFTHVSLIPGVVFSSYQCLDNRTWDNVPKKSILYSICTSKIQLYFAQIPIQEMGYVRCDGVGIYSTGTYPQSRNLRKKIPSQSNNQFSMGVLRFYSIQYSINLIGTHLKNLWDPTYVRFKTRYPTTRYPPAMILSRCWFLPHHNAGGHWLLQASLPQHHPIQAQRPHLEVLGNIAYSWFERITVGG